MLLTMVNYRSGGEYKDTSVAIILMVGDYRINWRIRYVSYSDICYLTGHSILSIRTILSYTRGQTLLASGSHVTYRISSPLW